MLKKREIFKPHEKRGDHSSGEGEYSESDPLCGPRAGKLFELNTVLQAPLNQAQ